MRNVLLCRFQQGLAAFPMFLLEGSSGTGLFRHLSNHVFHSPYFMKYIRYEGIFLSKCSEFDLEFKNSEKNNKKALCFLDNCI